jgi:ABC-type multidrug transport system fused ATPase/permease subunit
MTSKLYWVEEKKQCLESIRTLLRKAVILILDETTNDLD